MILILDTNFSYNFQQSIYQIRNLISKIVNQNLTADEIHDFLAGELKSVQLPVIHQL